MLQIRSVYLFFSKGAPGRTQLHIATVLPRNRRGGTFTSGHFQTGQAIHPRNAIRKFVTVALSCLTFRATDETPAMQRSVATTLREDATTGRCAFELIERRLFYIRVIWVFLHPLWYTVKTTLDAAPLAKHTNRTDFIYLVSIIGLKNESIFWDIFVDKLYFWFMKLRGRRRRSLLQRDVSGWSELVYMCVLRNTTERLHLYIYKIKCSREEYVLFLSLFLFWKCFGDFIIFFGGVGLWIEAVLNSHHKRNLLRVYRRRERLQRPSGGCDTWNQNALHALVCAHFRS